jgi:hypothetical protein
MPNLTRSTLYRCLRRRGFSRIGPTATSPPLTAAALRGPFTFEITAHEVVFRDPDDILDLLFPVLLAVEEITKHVYAEVAEATPESAAAFLANLVTQFAEKNFIVATEMLPPFTYYTCSLDEDTAAVSRHPFAAACRAHRIVHIRSIQPYARPMKIHSRGVEVRYSGSSSSRSLR